MASALEREGLQIPNADRLFIGGKWVSSAGSAVIDVIDPATAQALAQVADATAADMERAVQAARLAFDKGPWPRLTHRERARYLRGMAAGLHERADELSRMWTAEMGILHVISKGALPTIADIFNYYADLAESFPFEERHTTTAGGALGLLVREPVGVVAAIIPWNGPLALIAYKIAPALLAGCAVIIKAAPEAPGSAYIVAEVAQAIGIPDGVVNVLTAGREASRALVANPGIDKVAFTGSTDAGRDIATVCGGRIARYTLELGGKSAGVILDDYDVDAAAEAIVGPACMMTGQVCSSLTRIIVPRAKHDRLVDALSAGFAQVSVGDPFDPRSQMGPLAMERQLYRVEQFIERGIAEGATLATGGRRPPHLNRGFYIEPTVFGNVDNHSTIAREEIFGPVISVIPADNEQHAIDLANDSIFGLNASVFTCDVDRAYAVARELRSGTVGHNRFQNDFGIAFGGFKQSGIGREGGVEGLHSYLEAKTIILDDTPSHICS